MRKANVYLHKRALAALPFVDEVINLGNGQIDVR